MQRFGNGGLNRSNPGRHALAIRLGASHAMARLRNPKTPYDPFKDLAPVSLVATAPLVVIRRFAATRWNG